jgi:hypothetical protein
MTDEFFSIAVAAALVFIFVYMVIRFIHLIRSVYLTVRRDRARRARIEGER